MEKEKARPAFSFFFSCAALQIGFPLRLPKCLVLFSQGTQYPAGIAHGYDAARQVLGYDRPGGHHGFRPDGDARQHGGISANPDAVANGNGLSKLQLQISNLGGKRVSGCEKADPRP